MRVSGIRGGDDGCVPQVLHKGLEPLSSGVWLGVRAPVFRGSRFLLPCRAISHSVFLAQYMLSKSSLRRKPIAC